LKRLLLPALLALVIILIAVYRFYLSPQARAASHLAFVHDAITQMHPAVLDENAVAFHAWHSVAYEKAKALLPQVHSTADESALMNYYFAGYEDPHLAGYFTTTPYKFMDAQKDTWAGWFLAATPTDYKVIHSLGGEKFPPVGAQLISCDRQTIDNLLQQFYAPYIDKRWNIVNARNKAATAFARSVIDNTVLNRPVFKECQFKLVDGTEKNYPFQWLPLSVEIPAKLDALNLGVYKFPSVQQFMPRSYWVNLSDFQLNSPEAFKHQQKLLQDLSSLKDSAIIVLDFRHNRGGNTANGYNALYSLFGLAGIAYIEMERAKKLGSWDVIYRASSYSYWSLDFQLKKTIATEGDNSGTAHFLRAYLARSKQSIDNHENTFLLSELKVNFKLNGEESQKEIADLGGNWPFKGSVFLITDQHCVSACLDIVDMLKLIPDVVHLGQQTDADTAYEHIAYMWKEYLREGYSFMVPIMKISKRLRADNIAYLPDVIYDGDIYDDAAVEIWVKQQIALKLLQ